MRDLLVRNPNPWGVGWVESNKKRMKGSECRFVKLEEVIDSNLENKFEGYINNLLASQIIRSTQPLLCQIDESWITCLPLYMIYRTCIHVMMNCESLYAWHACIHSFHHYCIINGSIVENKRVRPDLFY